MTDAERLENAEAEIERLRGELVASRNILVSILRDTLLARPEVADSIVSQLAAEIARLEVVPGAPFRKEGAHRFYEEFSAQIRGLMASRH